LIGMSRRKIAHLPHLITLIVFLDREWMRDKLLIVVKLVQHFHRSELRRKTDF